MCLLCYCRLRSAEMLYQCGTVLIYRRWRWPSVSRTLRDDEDVSAATTPVARRLAGPAAPASRLAGRRRRSTAKTPICRGARTARTRVCSEVVADGAARWWNNTGTAAVPTTDAPPWYGVCVSDVNVLLGRTHHRAEH